MLGFHRALAPASLAFLAACASPLTFRWPEQAIWPGEARVLVARGAAVDVTIHCLGPGAVRIEGRDAGAGRLEAGTSAAVRLAGDSDLRLAAADPDRPTAVSVECEVREAVQLRFEPAVGARPVRIDFDGSVAVTPDGGLEVRVTGETAVTSLVEPGGAELRWSTAVPLGAHRVLEYADRHVFRGPLELRLSVDDEPGSALRLSIRDADDWSVRRLEPGSAESGQQP